MSEFKKIKAIVDSPMVSMGAIRLKQPLPTNGLENVDPFILIHHYGPYAISEFNSRCCSMYPYYVLIMALQLFHDIPLSTIFIYFVNKCLFYISFIHNHIS